LRLDRRWIQEHIPHKDGMCLLDEVLSWDLNQTQCRSSSHRSADNPLRAHGRLGSACGIEYAAQTMAVHGALVASAAGAVAPTGFLASVRGVRLNIDRLDVFEGDLVTAVQRVAGDESTALYEFSVSADDVVLLTGRAAIAFSVFAGLAQADTVSPARTESPQASEARARPAADTASDETSVAHAESPRPSEARARPAAGDTASDSTAVEKL
jgi:predicted hotdog family 3-hydroxylacyl-ACP dehydratase